MNQTPIFQLYSDVEGVKLVDFGGWEMPLNFQQGIIKEHFHVRNHAGLFDVSHMGEFIIEGEKAEAFADFLLTNKISGKNEGKCIYSPMCNKEGGIVDDVMVYRFSVRKLMLVVNAGNIQKDFNWIKNAIEEFDAAEELMFADESEKIVMLAVQGPEALSLLQKYTDFPLQEIKPFTFISSIEIAGMNCLVSRTGYTGEDGFEIYADVNSGKSLWKLLLHDSPSLLPIGLGARDTLRLEACLSLYGNELSESISPLEAGLYSFVKLNKDNFIGKDNLIPQKREILNCVMIDKGVPRHNYDVFFNEAKIGFVTSGAKSPVLNKFIALIIVEKDLLKTGDTLYINCGGQMKQAEITAAPFYKRS